jgi:TPR repeat protein
MTGTPELGRLFSRGLGISVDSDLAFKWYSSAVEIATAEDEPEDLREARQYIEGSKNS